jgi:hypothetical protein
LEALRPAASLEYLQLQELGRSQLHAVVTAQSENIGKSPSFFNQRLGHLHNAELIPAIDQALMGLFDVIPVSAKKSARIKETRGCNR